MALRSGAGIHQGTVGVIASATVLPAGGRAPMVAGSLRVVAVIGGMHLLHATETRLERTAEALKEYAIPCVIPCHCTGDAACAYLAERLGSPVQPGYAGMKVSF